MHSLLERISKLRILVIGDAMLDHYIWGDVHRISPEAPVPVVHASRDSWTAGGAANVALNLSNLGVQTHLLGHIADDEAGHRLLRILHDHQVSFSRPLAASTSPTIIKTRVMARGQQLCRIDREAAPALYAAHRDPDFMEALRQALAHADAVIVSDYAKGFINQHILDAIVHQSSHTPLLIAIDPKPASHLCYHGAGILTPNRSEALELAGLAQPHPDAPTRSTKSAPGSIRTTRRPCSSLLSVRTGWPFVQAGTSMKSSPR